MKCAIWCTRRRKPVAEQIPAYCLLAEFGNPERLLEAARSASEQGYRKLDAYSSFPIEGMQEAIGPRHLWVAPLVLGGGIFGGAAAYFMQYYPNVISYPLNIGGRPYHSWPSFIPITFELTVLGAAFAAFFGLLALCRLPKPFHPVFNHPAFLRASTDKFFLSIESADPKFDSKETRLFLEGLHPDSIAEVPW